MVGVLAAPALAHPSFPHVGPGFANPNGGTRAGTQTPPYAPGSIAVPGWSCALETVDGHDVLHWSGPQVSPTQTAADSAQFFTFQATVPSPTNQTSYGAFGGPEGFFAVQVSANGGTAIWKSPNDPRPATDVATDLVRTVADTSPPPGPPPVVRGGDGKIVFQSARDGNNEIYLMNANGSGQTPVDHEHGLRHHTVAPPGRHPDCLHQQPGRQQRDLHDEHRPHQCNPPDQ